MIDQDVPAAAVASWELPGTRSDLLVLPPESEVRRTGTFLRVATPGRPDYWYGNYLIVAHPPDGRELRDWLDVWKREFDGLPGLRRMIFSWEVPGSTPCWPCRDDARLPAEIEFEESSVLVLRQLVRPAVLRPDLSVRAAPPGSSEELAIEQMMAEELGQSRGNPFVLWKAGVYRKLARAGLGHLWGAWRAGELLAAAGLFHRDGLGRFQDVVTRASVRRQGVCSTLLHGVLESTSRTRGLDPVIIVAETGSTADRVYSSVGFARESTQHAAIGPVTLARDPPLNRRRRRRPRRGPRASCRGPATR